MKVQVVFSSLSGCTKKVAQGIFDSLEGVEKSIHDLKDGAPKLDGDIILLGYWVDRGGPNEEMKELLSQIKEKAVGLFCTLGYYADSEHAQKSISAGVNMVNENNTVIGSYVCNGTLSPDMIAKFRQAGGAGPHAATPEKEIRWKIMESHPTQAEIALAAERFNERVELYKQFKEQGLKFTSIQ